MSEKIPGTRRRGLVPLNTLGTRIVLFFVALLVIVQGLGAFLVIQANSQIARQTIDRRRILFKKTLELARQFVLIVKKIGRILEQHLALAVGQRHLDTYRH